MYRDITYDWSYHHDLVLTGNGGISADLIPSVARVLVDVFGFEGLSTIINNDIDNIKPFTDQEPRQNIDKNDVEKGYGGKHVVILEYLKAIDNRLTHTVRDLQQLASKAVFEDRQDADRLARIVDRLAYHTMPDLEHNVAPRFDNGRINPSTMEKQLAGQIRACTERFGAAKHVTFAMPMSIFEWSHNYLKKWDPEKPKRPGDPDKKPRYEMPAWQDFLEHMSHCGADSAVMLHPHAPTESLEVSALQNLNLVMAYPQTYTLSSNGFVFSIDDLFSEFTLDPQNFDPVGVKMSAEIEAIGEEQKYRHLLMYVSSVDRGSRVNAKLVGKRFGLGYVESLKDRQGEGRSRISESEDLGKYLKQLKEYRKDGTIKVFIFDDMMNSGSTADEEAKLRKEQVSRFNKDHNTSYDVECELVVTHFRYRCLEEVQHAHLDKVMLFNTVPYLPPLQQQIIDLGLQDKFEVVEKAHYQLAMGIALDYFFRRIHRQMGNATATGRYRENTDHALSKHTSFGTRLENLRWSNR
ncbi:hypothetical protein GF351_02690 [Candidatus Woesearchaeota archaeon]|nr:hypothetical protein [Candidatus Woesearchaeota archaeon]